MSVTLEEHKAHLQAGADMCLVCGCNPLVGSWTDYNGQIRCMDCGTTYQILGSHHTDEFLAKIGLTKNEVAKKYCDCFTVLPVLRDYWRETEAPIPFGSYMGRSPIPEAHYNLFYRWLAEHVDKYRAEFPDEFNWDRLLKKYPVPA